MTGPIRHLAAAFLISLMIISCAPTANQTDLIRLRQLKDQAFSGDPESQYSLGIHYTTSSQWAWDKSRGYQWFRDAAEQGHQESQYMVGMAKWLGRGTGKDRPGAIEWLEKAAFKGHARSQYQLGQAFLNGQGTAKDQAWGRQWLEQAARQEHKDAQFLLSALFYKGIGGKANRPEAWRWLNQAKRNGHPQAEQGLSKMTKELSAEQLKLAKNLTSQIGQKRPDGLFTTPLWRYLQVALNEHGLNAGIEDGINGPTTLAAIKRYQDKNKLPHDIQLNNLIGHLRGSQFYKTEKY